MRCSPKTSLTPKLHPKRSMQSPATIERTHLDIAAGPRKDGSLDVVAKRIVVSLKQLKSKHLGCPCDEADAGSLAGLELEAQLMQWWDADSASIWCRRHLAVCSEVGFLSSCRLQQIPQNSFQIPLGNIPKQLRCKLWLLYLLSVGLQVQCLWLPREVALPIVPDP